MRDPLPHHRRVAVLGLGASGRAACRLLVASGKDVIASDGRAELELELPAQVAVHGGANGFVGDATAAVLSPSCNPDWPENRAKPELAALFARAERGEIELLSEIELAARALEVPFVTVGGTDGKSTTAALTAEVLRQSGARTLLGGNSWTAASDVVLREGDDADVAVFEVSAFQLWDPHAMRPQVALLTNIAPDHLDHYGHEDDYVWAKLRIFEHLADDAWAVLNAGDARLAAYRSTLQSRGLRCVGFAESPPSDAWDAAAYLDGDHFRWRGLGAPIDVPVDALRIPGRHNRRNALAAVSVARGVWGERVSADAIGRAFGAFAGLPHRLEWVADHEGAVWFDDSKATNVHAAVTGLCSVDRPVVAIVGGVDKGLDLSPLLDVLAERARHVVVIGELRDRLPREAQGRFDVRTAGSMADAVTQAAALARSGDAVLLSPASSSFDMFDSFEDRGRKYQAEVRALTAAARC